MATRAGALVTWLLTAYAFSSSGLAAQDRLSITELWRTDGASAGLALEWVTDAVVDENGRVWILDEYRAVLSVWEWPSVERPPTNPRAVGDGTFEAPVALARRPEGGVAVLDVVRRSVLPISSGGELNPEVSLQGAQLLFPKDFLILEEGQFVVLGGSMQGAAGVRVFSSSGAPIVEGLSAESIGHDRTTAMVAGGVAVASEGNLIVSLAQRPGLYAVDVGTGAAELLDPLERLFPTQGSDFVTRTDEVDRSAFLSGGFLPDRRL